MPIVIQGFTGKESKHQTENMADEAFAQLHPAEMYEAYPLQLIAAVNRILERQGLGLSSRWDIECALKQDQRE